MACDIITKVKENLKEHSVFPTSLHIYQKTYATWSSAANDGGSFKKTVKMVTYEDFKEDPSCLTAHMLRLWRESYAEGLLPFPAMMLGATAQLFKPVCQIKLPSRKIDNIFGKPQDSAEKERLKRANEEKQRKLNEQIKLSK